MGSYEQDLAEAAEKAAYHRENQHYEGSELLRHILFSRNESTDRKPESDYQQIFIEEFLKEVARKAASFLLKTSRQ